MGESAPVAAVESLEETTICEWAREQTFDRLVKRLGRDSELWGTDMMHALRERTREELPYYDGKTYVEWLRKQWVKGNALLDVFFFPSSTN